MSCCCKKKDKAPSQPNPDCMATKTTTVRTPEGEDVEVNFNMGTGEVTYGKSPCCEETSHKGSSCGCKTK